MNFLNIDFITTFISLAVGYQMLFYIFPRRAMTKIKKFQYIFWFAVLLVAIIYIFNLLFIPNILSFLFTIVYISVTSMNLFDTKLKYVIGAISIHLLNINIYNNLVMFLVKLLMIVSKNNYETRIALVYLLHFCFFLVLPLIYKQVILKIGKGFFIKYYKFLFAFSIISFTVLLIYPEHSFVYMNKEILTDQLGFFVLGILSIFLIILFFTYYEKEKEKGIIELKEQMSQENFKRVRDSYEANAKIYHDLGNHLLILQSLIEQNENEKSLEYIMNISEPLIANYYQESFTTNSVINFLVNYKVEIMRMKKISYQIEIDVPATLNITDNDMVTILANIIDNAIEACEKIQEVDKRMIKITIKKIKEMLFMKLENSFQEELQIYGKFFKSSKVEKKFHGWGIKSVTTIVDKYEGIITNKLENNMFVIVISLSDNK